MLREGCDAGTNPIPAANRLMANEYRLTPKPTVRLPANPTWRENPFHDNLWQFHYHSLVYVLQLEGAWARTGENRYLDRAVFLLRDWLRDNPRSNPPSPFSWNDHSTAWRAAVLACTAEIVPVSTWLRQALLLHGSTLADPAFYRRHGNHALNQSIALLDVGHVLNRTDWMQLASARINALIEESVDVQGVTNEQSIGYQLYNYRRYLSAEDRLHACGQPISRAFARVAKMPTFLGWATLPNGEYELIGDTSAAAATSIPGTLAEFAATAGTSGPPPAADFMAYDAGYAFGRTGWGAARPFADEVAWSMRYGPGVQIHGHADGGSLNVYGHGSRLLVGSGTYSYNPGPYRTYFLGRTAQNVVTVDGVAYRPGATTPLLGDVVTRTAFGVTVRIQGYAGISDVRSVAFSRRLGFLLVDDRLTGTSPRRFVQLWHLAPDSHPAISGRTVRTAQAGGDVVIRQLADAGAIDVVKGETAPIQGWLTYTYNTKVAAPVVETSQRGSSVRFLTLIAPVTAPTVPVQVTSVVLRSDGYSAVVRVGGHTDRVVVRGTEVTITAVN